MLVGYEDFNRTTRKGRDTGGTDHHLPTTIIEMNAGTGLDYIEDTRETIRGSSGHALDIKTDDRNDASKLNVILVEGDQECFFHLKQTVIKEWPSINFEEAIGSVETNRSGVYCLQRTPKEALDLIEGIELGNSLFFFDPLLFTPWEELERVASRRIKSYYETRTEFIVFLFTTDWFIGRKKMVPLPKSIEESTWNDKEKETVRMMDDLFGNSLWQKEILTDDSIETRMDKLVQAYRVRLHRWFRYVLLLPFNPRLTRSTIFSCVLIMKEAFR